MNKKGASTGVVILLILILVVGGFIAYKVYFPTGAVIKNILEPKLSISGVNFEGKFGLSKGCSTNVEGYVSNVGNANANDVSVTCRLIRSGGGTTSGSKSVGSVSTGSNSYFTMIINNDCPGPDDVTCSATCPNCN